MAIRKDIVFTVAADGRSVTPTVPQDGGVQGEHNATRVIFHVGESSVWENPDYTVYIECEDKAGNIDTTEPLVVEGGQVAVLLSLAWTQYGGISTLRLVAEGADGTIAYMAEGAVRFTSRQNASQKVDGLLKGRLATMERRAGAALTAAEAAEKSAEDVLAAAETAKNVAEEKASAVSATAQNVLEAETRIERRETNVIGAANAALDAASRAAASAESVLMHASSAGQAAVNAAGLAKAAQEAAQQASAEIEAARDTLGGYVVKTSQYAVKSEQSALAAERAAEEAKRIEEKIGSVALLPLKFTITKSEGGQYTSSKTYQELSDALAEGRTLICVLEERELPLSNISFQAIVFAADIAGVQYDVSIGYRDGLRANVYINTNTIKIGDQMWGGEDEEWNVDFTDTINEMINDKLNNITPGTPAAANFGVINARDYGAKGDGKTDDTAAIQAALYAAEEQKVPLYIPAGHYRVSKTISTHTRDTDSDKQSKELNIFGAGMNTRILAGPDFECDPAMPYVFVIDVANAQPRQLWVHDFAINLYADVSGIYFHEIGMKSVIENLWITYVYNKDPADTNVRAGIYCREATVATFQRIKVYGNHEKPAEGGKNIGIVCRKTFSVRFIDCDIIYCKWAIYLSGGSNNLIEHCRIDENEYGIYQNSSGSEYMDDTRAYPRDGKSFIGSFRNLTIRNNRFESNNQQAIFLAAYGTGTRNYLYNAQVTIANNYFSNLGKHMAFQSTVREVFSKAILLYRCKGVVIENNLFKGKPYDETVEDTLLQIIAGRCIEDITLRGNVALEHSVGKDENGNTIVVKTNTKFAPQFLNNKEEVDKSLAEQGIVDDIEVDQSTRDRWRVELGNVDAALDSIIAIQESFIGGDGE